MNAPSAVEAQRRDPHAIPVGKILVWRLLVLQNVGGRFHVRILGPIEWRDRLSAEIVGKLEEDSVVVSLGVLLGGFEAMVGRSQAMSSSTFVVQGPGLL